MAGAVVQPPLTIRKNIFSLIDEIEIPCYNVFMKQDYYQERNLKNLDRIEGLLQELPSFCEDFLRGVEMRTSVLTRLNYC